MLFVAVNHMPGLEPLVFVLPMAVILVLGGILGSFYYRYPYAGVPVEIDRDADRGDDNAGAAGGSAAGRDAAGRRAGITRIFSAAHYDRVVPLIIAVLFYLLALWRLGYPQKQVFDEVHHVRTAMEFVWGMNPHEWTHPHLSKLLQAESLTLAREYFDPSEGVWSPDATFSARAAIAWRLPSVIFGTLALLGQYALARALFKNRAVATLAMLLLAADGVFFVQSRIAMTNIFTVCFIIWAAWAAWRWTEEQRPRHLFGMGLFLGLAIATRWSSLYAFALLFLSILADAVTRWQKAGWSGRYFLGRAALFTLALLVVPCVIYAATYIPFVLQGGGTLAQKLLTWNYNLHGWGKVLSQQGDMYHYHSTLVADHNYDSPAWSWPLMLRPVWYFFDKRGPVGAEIVRGIWCVGNAFIWWAFLPTMAAGTWVSVRFRRSNLALVCLLGLGQWFCWLAKARGLNFMHYLFEAIPFVCIALAYFLVTLWQPGKKKIIGINRYLGELSHDENHGQWRIVVASYLLAVLIWFVFYYPMLTAAPITGNYSERHFWLGRIWI